MNHKICLAPMLDWTDTHFRYFMRLLSPHCFLYTEMMTAGALLHGNAKRFLAYHPEEHPVALQVGGSDPKALAQCVQMALDYGYDEINLNVGCPSDRVQSGRFGACLMKEPQLVAECVAAMKAKITKTTIGSGMMPAISSNNAIGATGGRPLNPIISVKCRIGVDEQEDYHLLEDFVRLLKVAGCDLLIVHARKALLKGLSPKENREIPPLNYPWVYQLKKSFPTLPVIINGGIKTVDDAQEHLQYVDGVMVGRSAYENPYLFRQLEEMIFLEDISVVHRSRLEIVLAYLPYIEKQLARGVRLSLLIRPILGIFNGLPGARQWRRYLSTYCHAMDAGIEIVKHALSEFASNPREKNW